VDSRQRGWLGPCSVAKNFAKWSYSTFRCYLTISVQSWSN
jgi:hypothetical protein